MIGLTSRIVAWPRACISARTLPGWPAVTGDYPQRRAPARVCDKCPAARTDGPLGAFIATAAAARTGRFWRASENMATMKKLAPVTRPNFERATRGSAICRRHCALPAHSAAAALTTNNE